MWRARSLTWPFCVLVVEAAGAAPRSRRSEPWGFGSLVSPILLERVGGLRLVCSRSADTAKPVRPRARVMTERRQERRSRHVHPVRRRRWRIWTRGGRSSSRPRISARRTWHSHEQLLPPQAVPAPAHRGRSYRRAGHRVPQVAIGQRGVPQSVALADIADSSRRYDATVYRGAGRTLP
jgi:hypothetical protein